MINKDELEAWVEKIRSMGSTDEIARFLYNEGVAGTPGSGTSCPLANFFAGKVGARRGEIIVHGWSGVTCLDDTGGYVIKSSRVIGDFVALFDGGAFSYLRRPAQ